MTALKLKTQIQPLKIHTQLNEHNKPKLKFIIRQILKNKHECTQYAPFLVPVVTD